MAHRILHLLSQRPHWTGSGVALDAIASIAQEKGWEQAAVVGTPRDDPNPTVATIPSALVYPMVFEEPPIDFRLPGMSDVMPYPSSRFSALSEEQIRDYCRSWSAHISRVIDSFQPDLIHSNHVWLMSSLARSEHSNIPFVIHSHGTGLRQLQLCPHLAERTKTGCRQADHFVVLSQANAEQLRHALSIADSRVTIVGSGYREDIFHSEGRSEPDNPVVTYAGKLSHAKGVPELIQAVRKLAKNMPHLQLNLVGGGAGEEADAIRDSVVGDPNIKLHGQIDQKDLAHLFRQSSIFVLPSYYEGLPLVLVEAAACGCRLVASDLPGIVGELKPLFGDGLALVERPAMESIDRPVESGLPGYVDRLSEAIKDSIRQSRTNGMGEKANAMTWSAVFDRIEQVWQTLIRR